MDLYQIGDEAVYIQPDYCVPNTPLFKSFTEPGGDPKKSKLGRNGRIFTKKIGYKPKNRYIKKKDRVEMNPEYDAKK